VYACVCFTGNHYAAFTPAESSGATLRWWRTDVTPSFSSGGSGGGGGSAADNATSASSDAAAAAAGGRLWVSFPCASRPGRLAALLSERTRVVAVTHVSNLLGGVADLRALVATVRRHAPRGLTGCATGLSPHEPALIPHQNA
jgi:hypothetical protein